jgi:aspartate aminotransferase
MAAVASETFTAVSAPIQYAAVRAFEGDIKIERYLWQVRRILSRLAERCVAILRQADIDVHLPDGAFYLFPSFSRYRERLAVRGITGSLALSHRLLEDTGVAVLPGEAFGRPAEELSVRIAYVDFDGLKALTAGETIPIDQPLPADFVDCWCKKVITAMELLVNWLTD